MDFSQVLLSHRPLIVRISQALTARYRMAPADVEDFTASVQLRLIENDYAVLRAYEGRSEWSTYLFAVIRRQLHDWQRARWGRWRPSAAARRLGPDAMLYERLINVDRLSASEAGDLVRARDGATVTQRDLDTLAATTTAPQRQMVSEEALANVASPHGEADRLVEQRDLATLAGRVTQLLHTALAALQVEDRLILQLRFEQNMSMAAIGRVLGVEGKSLYRRVDRTLTALKQQLVVAGVAEADVNVVLRAQGFDLLVGEPPAEEGRSS